MKQPVTRELFEYWNALRGTRCAPMRDDIDPGAIRGRLANIFLLNFDDEHGHPFRLAGSSICTLFGRELRDEAFAKLWSPVSQPSIAELLHNIAQYPQRACCVSMGEIHPDVQAAIAARM